MSPWERFPCVARCEFLMQSGSSLVWWFHAFFLLFYKTSSLSIRQSERYCTCTVYLTNPPFFTLSQAARGMNIFLPFIWHKWKIICIFNKPPTRVYRCATTNRASQPARMQEKSERSLTKQNSLMGAPTLSSFWIMPHPCLSFISKVAVALRARRYRPSGTKSSSSGGLICARDAHQNDTATNRRRVQ